MEPIIQIHNVTKTYNLYEKPADRLKEALSVVRHSYHKEHHALKNVNLDICKGESVGIIGTNGAGKSTLLKMITGVLKPTEGSITVNGKISALLELGAGFNMEYTGIQNIYLNGTMMGYSREEIKKRVPAIVEFADIGEFVEQPVKTYSSGMFARLAFAVAINVEPEILIVDEALSVGDTRFQVKCIDKMKELKSMGTTILFVSHATEQIKRFCNRAVWMEHGAVKMDGESSQIVDLYENYMKFGIDVEDLLNENDTEYNAGEKEEKVVEEKAKNTSLVGVDAGTVQDKTEKDMLAAIRKVSINKNIYHTFDKLEAEVEYEIFEDQVPGFLVGVAIYTADRKEYVFGPNTHLEKIEVPSVKGKHKVIYEIPQLPLIQGAYVIDVGIFNNEGIVNLDYKMSVKGFSVSNQYFSEGTYYIQHNWKNIY